MDTTGAGTAERQAAMRMDEQPMTERVVRIWCDVLEHEVSVDDDFSDLGGTALDAVLIASRASAEFGVELPLSVVFDYPTVREFTGALVEQLASADRDERDRVRTGR